MKKLERMLLMNWHNFSLQVIPFEMITFLTGKNSSGKSTIIDAMQLVLLGDTSGTFFNKAANQKSTRTLQSYLFGEQGDDGEAGFMYKRSGHFMTYVALEFHDTELNSYFTASFAAECYKDRSFSHMWFIVPEKLPSSLFHVNDVPMNREQLKDYIRQASGEWYQSNREYRAALLAREGAMKEKYLSLLRKAVPFTPMNDITRFITEYICDVESEIDVMAMQSDIRKYTELEHDAEIMKSRITRLEEIGKSDESYQGAKEILRLQQYIAARAAADDTEHAIEENRALLEKLSEENSRNSENLRLLEAEIEELNDEIEKLRRELYSSDEKKREENLKARKKELTAEKEKADAQLSRLVARLQRFGKFWIEALDRSSLLSLDFTSPSFMLSDLSSIKDSELADYPFAEAEKYIKSLKNTIWEKWSSEKSYLNEIEKSITSLDSEIERLEKGIKPFPSAVVRLQERLSALSDGKPVILADVTEVENPMWRNAVEGCLGNHRFDILLSHDMFGKAVDIISEYEGEGVSAVDIDSIPDSEVLPESLYEEISTENPYADKYLRFLLGCIVKGSSGEAYINTGAICFHDSRIEAIGKDVFAFPFLGRAAVDYQIRERKREKEEKEKERELSSVRGSFLEDSKDGPELPPQEMIAECQSAFFRLPLIDNEIAAIDDELSCIDTMYFTDLEKQIDEMKLQEKVKQTKRDSIVRRAGELDSDIRRLADYIIPDLEEKVASAKTAIETEYDSEWIASTGEIRYQKEKDGNKGGRSLLERFTVAISSTMTRISNLRVARDNLRADYNSAFQMGLDARREDNDEYNAELSVLRDVKLPEYLEKIKDAKATADKQFRDDFISRIKENIENVRRQIDSMNSMLRHFRFGRDRYRFTVQPNKEYKRFYDMFMDPLLMRMNEGDVSIFQDSFTESHKKEIDELFGAIILSGSEGERRAEFEEAIRRYTDYRTYLTFDFVVTDEDSGRDQRLSVMMGKKSGGETQLPFYISLLVSFAQVCRIRSTSHNNTVRLIILDEAFSKMDGERIRESIRLLREIGLQAVFSAPPEKLGDIDPLSDETLIALRSKDSSYVRRKKRADA